MSMNSVPLHLRTARVHRSRASRHRARAGFSLIELMVSLAIGGIAIGAIYTVGAASTRHFREQQRISTSQSALRNAMDVIKRDFQRAGYMATPNAGQVSQQCGGIPPSALLHAPLPSGAGSLAAISRFEDNVTNLDQTPTSLNNGAAMADAVTLMGNYSTAGEYAGISLDAQRTGIYIPQNWQSFRRDFTNWFTTNAVPPVDTTLVSSVWVANRLVRIHARNETYYFGQLAQTATAAVGTTPQVITLANAYAVPNSCNASLGWVSPVNAIRYWVATPTAATTDEAALYPTASGPVNVLHRTEVDPSDKVTALGTAQVPVDDRALLPYVVSFNLRFIGNNPVAVSPRNSVLWQPMLQSAINATPESIVGVLIDLAVRTPEQDPTLTPIVGPPLRTFVVSALGGNARVRTMHAELLLPNVAYSN